MPARMRREGCWTRVDHAGVWEVTFAPDGRPTFGYGEEREPGEHTSLWRRVADHSILADP